MIVSTRLFEAYKKALKKANEDKVADLVMTSFDLLKDGKLGTGARALALAKRMRLGEAKPDDARAAEKLLESRGG